MRAGALNRRVAVDEPLVTQGLDGGEVITWQNVTTVSASIEPIRGREALIAGANLAIMDTRIRMRWSPTVDRMTAKWRLRIHDRVYDVVSVVEIREGRRELEIMGKSGANNG